MGKIMHYTEGAVDKLRSSVCQNLDWYFDGNDVPPIAEGHVNPVRASSFDVEYDGNLLDCGSESNPEFDGKNALTVYTRLKNLTPQAASMEKLWCWLTHNECAEYVRRRWLSKDLPDEDARIRAVKNHFFANGSRAVFRDNGISRLWWLGHIANRINPENPDDFLDVVLLTQDIRSSLIERPSIAMNDYVLRGICRIMKKELQRAGSKAKLFEREVFRSWMKGLNRTGGMIVLDAIAADANKLDKVLQKEADKAVG